MLRAFVKHPRSVGESYTEHFVMASGFGSRMMLAGLACLLHGLFPFLFEHTGSRCISKLHGRMAARRTLSAAQPASAEPVSR